MTKRVQICTKEIPNKTQLKQDSIHVNRHEAKENKLKKRFLNVVELIQEVKKRK